MALPRNMPSRRRLSPEALELVAARFRLLGEPARLRLLASLEAGERTVTDLVELTGLSQTNTSRHLAALAEGGILARRKVGLNVLYRIADPSIFQLCDHVCGSLQKRLASQAQAFDTATPRPPKSPLAPRRPALAS